MALRALDLFSGIGGFALGLERAGIATAAFCEIDPYCRRVLRRHWPETPIYDDIESLGWERLCADGLWPDVPGRPGINTIVGGFPCQDISLAGSGGGLDGDRSGLWREMRRLIRELRPQYAILENVPALLGRGLGEVLGDLAALGYDAEWHCIPAAAVGAPHLRDRVWVVAHPDGAGLSAPQQAAILTTGRWEEGRAAAERYWRPAEPDLVRVAHGGPSRVDRIRSLGNAVVPQIPEIIGRALVAHDAERAGAVS